MGERGYKKKKSIIRKIEPGTSQFSQTLESINQSQSKIWNEFPKNEIGQLCSSFNSLLQTCINSNWDLISEILRCSIESDLSVVLNRWFAYNWLIKSSIWSNNQWSADKLTDKKAAYNWWILLLIIKKVKKWHVKRWQKRLLANWNPRYLKNSDSIFSENTNFFNCFIKNKLPFSWYKK